MLAKYTNNCEQNRRCKVRDILKDLDNTEQMKVAVEALLSAFKSTHQSICGDDHKGLCNSLKTDSRLFYSTLMNNLLNSTSVFEVSGVRKEIGFDSNGDLTSETFAPVFTVHIARNNSSQWDFHPVGFAYQNQTIRFTDMASLKQQTVISKYTDTAKECIREEPPYVFQYKNSPLSLHIQPN